MTISKQVINIGNQPNDGTGDSIRDAFSKTNQNFDTLFALTGIGEGLYFTSLLDTPETLSPNKILITDNQGLTITQVSLVGGTGIRLSAVDGQILIENTASSLSTDLAPTLSANLDGAGYRARSFGDPTLDQDLVTRQWVYNNFLNRSGSTTFDINTGSFSIPVIDTTGSTLLSNIRLLSNPTELSHVTNKDYVDQKISLAGQYSIDSRTNLVNPAFGTMTGPLQLFRDPIETDNPLIAATKNYVDNNGYASSVNLYVTKKGRDFQPEVPAGKRGRFYQYAFSSINRAATYADQLIATSKIEVGDYARLITYNDGIACTVNSTVFNYLGGPLSRLVLDAGGNGSDQFGVATPGQYTIFPGQYIQGVESKAIALIERIDRGGGSQGGSIGQEIYSIDYVDYASSFDTPLTVSIPDNINFPNRVLFEFVSSEIVPIPDFWLGYVFFDSTTGMKGTILEIYSNPDVAGSYHDSFLVEFSAPYTATAQISAEDWKVFSGEFQPGETVVYNTNVSSNQITIFVESGDYAEQLPIKVPANTSIKGDTFRRVIIRPAAGISSSPWANTYFKRDTQIDGLQAVSLNTATNYAPNVAVTPSGTVGIINLALASGSLSTAYKGYMFRGANGQGVITDIQSGVITVDVGTALSNTNTISAGNWAIYKPINFGYHYLRDSSKPMNLLTSVYNPGGLINAAKLLELNRDFIRHEVAAYIAATYPSFIFNNNECLSNIGLLVDSLVNDMLLGGSGKTINIADTLSQTTSFTTGEYSAGINRINTVGQLIIDNLLVTPTTGNTRTQVIDTDYTAETSAGSILADLVQAAADIVDLDPDFNPPKHNSELDVFLCNDANYFTFLSVQNHGGFMCVLDPVGQVKNKSPYIQSASSFSQSIAKQALRGGMFVDGFAGNILATPTTSTFANSLQPTVKGLVRRPEVPTFFVNNGIRYEVTFFNDFQEDPLNPGTYTATLNLNPLTPGGIPNTVTVSDISGGFRANQTNIPISIDAPSGTGGISARGRAITNASGTVTSIVISFPGTGYITKPTITIGGALLNNLQIANGVITGLSIVNAGQGYTTATSFTVVPVGTTSVTTATGRVTSVNTSGGILAVTFTGAGLTGGSGWSNSIEYEIKFGNVTINVPNPVAGFIDAIPVDPTTNDLKSFELITAGNRSMLANDFTQVNDLGYGIFVTNGGFAENVSMFTYYCYRSYYSLNGAQIRSLTGSSCYGEFGLCAEGSDPTEVPTSATLSFNLSQIVYVYSPSVQYPAFQNQTSIHVYVDLNNDGYPPLSGSEIEINHNGIVKIYKIGSAAQALDSQNQPIYFNNDVSKPVYLLTFNTGNISSNITGLYDNVANNTPITFRQLSRFKYFGFDPNSFSRPSTSITFVDDPEVSYNVTSYTKLTNENSVLVDTLQDYEYITTTAVDQGLTYPVLTSTGSSYVSTATVTISTTSLVASTSTTVSGNQGSPVSPVQVITLNSVNNIYVGHVVTSSIPGAILTGTTVTFVNTATNQIGISQLTNSTLTNASTLTFTAILPSVRAVMTGSNVSRLVVDNGGTGWNATTTTISISGNASVQSPINIAGSVGSRIIKVFPLTLSQQNRIVAGLNASPPYYYQFALNNQLFNIIGYRSTSVTGQTWAEIETAEPLTFQVTPGSILNIGVASNSLSEIKTRISLLRATGHDFVDVGTGGYADTRIPNDLYGPPINRPQQSKEISESGPARVYYTTTDQDGNFRVGAAFLVNQAQGSVSINAPIDLNNLSAISLKKDAGPPITEFSVDNFMSSQADFKVPTEQAVVNYINRRLGIDSNGNLYSGTILGNGMMPITGIRPMQGAIDMNGTYNIVNMPGPRFNSGTDAANKNYVDQRIERRGTAAKDVNGTTDVPIWGLMTGPLQLFGDPQISSTVTTVTATSGNVLTVGASRGTYLGLGVTGAGIPAGTVVTGTNATQIILSANIISTVTSGTTLTFDPVVQAATKGYVDRNSQFNQLRDVSITSATNQDLLMFGSTVLQPQSASGNTPAIYNTATQIINVSNNTATITNTTSTTGGGSDITITRTNNTVTFKLVGGRGANNPITDFHINNNAAIAQSKLSLNAATTRSSASGITQADRGSASFNSSIFSASSGWISLIDATSTTTGVTLSKLQWLGSSGGLLGSISGGAITALSSATIRSWLQVLQADGGVVNGNLRVNGLFTASNISVTGGLTVNGIITGSQQVIIGSDLQVAGSGRFIGSLTVTNTTSLLSGLSVTGVTNLNGNLIANVGSLNSTTNTVLELSRIGGLTSNATNLVTRLVRHTTGTDWTTAALRLQALVDVNDQAYIDFNPNGGSYALAFGTGGESSNPTEKMRISANGKVSIGTTATTSALHIEFNDSNDLGVRIRQRSTTQFADSGIIMNGPVGSGSQGGTAFYHTNLNIGGTEGAAVLAQVDENGTFQRTLAQYNYALQTWSFLTNGVERLTIDDQGSIGIGINAPDTGLHIRVTNRSTDGLIIDSTGNDRPYIRFLPDAGAGVFNNLVQDGDQVLVYSSGTQNTGNLSIVPWSGTASGIRLDSGGNLGIGTTNIGARLDVAGGARISGITTITNTSSAISTVSGALQVAGGVGIGRDIVVGGNIISANPALITSAVGSAVYTTGTAIVSASQQGGRLFEISHDFNSYPNLYSSMFINVGSAVNVPSGMVGNGYRFIMGAGDAAQRGFDLVGTSGSANNAQLWIRARENGTSTWARLYTTNDSINASNISGILSLTNGGTGASTAANARTNLGLGTIATLTSVSLTTNVSGILGTANGGTGASSVIQARTNLGLGSTDSPAFNGITLTGTAQLGNVANIKIAGGSSGQVLRTDGSGNLTWAGVGTITGISTPVGSGLTGGTTSGTASLSVTAPTLYHVTGGYTGGGKVNVGSTPPVDPAVGDIWIEI